MKNIANIISICRVIISIILLFIYKNSTLFIIMYMICGISDVIDGYIARKTNTQSKIGAMIDSLADLVMFIVIIVIMLDLMKYEIIKFLPFILTIGIIRILNLIYAKHKFKKFAFIHTIGNKLAGFLIFISPIAFAITHNEIVIIFVCIIAIISACEESIIHITLKELDLDRLSIFK